jgi:hypothetical protein
MSDFWNKLIAGHTETTVPNAVDQRIKSREFGGELFTGMQSLTDAGKAASALDMPVEAGTKVSFLGTLGAVLTYSDSPDMGELGEVVSVRSANGDVTSHDGRVFVKWSSGKLIPVYAEHLRAERGATEPKVASEAPDFEDIPIRVSTLRVASFGDLSAFLKVADNTLVHKSTKDLWAFEKDADGGLVVKRLFDGDGKPLKG